MSEPTAALARPPLFAFLAIAVSLPLCAAYVLLCMACGLHEYFAGFLFIAYWGGVEGASKRGLAPTLCGSLLGFALGFCLKLLSLRLGGAQGGGAFVLLIVPILYCLLTNKLTLFVNHAAMLMLTVATISHVQRSANFIDMFASFALGALYFGTILATVQSLAARRAAAG